MTEETPHQVYDRLWAQALDAFSTGGVRVDPHLHDPAHDMRCGMTLVARPDAAAQARLMALIEQIQAVAPGQYFYRADELHITVLSLISATPDFDRAALPLDDYHTLLDSFFRHERPFRVCYQGVTASPDAVLVYGDSEGDALNGLRDRLRAALAAAGLTGTMDKRYRLTTTHSSIVRFKAMPADPPALVRLLAAVRAHDFGAFEVDQVELTLNDWYMSHGRTEVLARYALGE
ncbi:MAG: hypothetical protein GXY36_19485 [Chloroflexi bacterium]|nr:hypothetical protein [Chloroflexota bacterium]